jgi:hypothetical protein
METKTQITEDLKKIKESFSEKDLKENLKTAINEIKEIAKAKDYVIEGDIDKLLNVETITFDSLSSRKKLSRKIYFFMKKKSIKTANSLLAFARRRFLSEEPKISISPSLLEQQRLEARKKYKALMKEAEVARLVYKEAKKKFNEKNI